MYQSDTPRSGLIGRSFMGVEVRPIAKANTQESTRGCFMDSFAYHTMWDFLRCRLHRWNRKRCVCWALPAVLCDYEVGLGTDSITYTGYGGRFFYLLHYYSLPCLPSCEALWAECCALGNCLCCVYACSSWDSILIDLA